MNTNQNKSMQLKSVIGELLSCYLKVHPGQSSQIVHEVSGDFRVGCGKDWLAPIMGDLFAIFSTVNENETIHISAKLTNGNIKLYGDIKKRVISINRSITHLPTLAILPYRIYSGIRA